MFSEALASLAMSVMVDGKKLSVRLKPGDLIRYERKFDKPMSALGGEDGVRFEELAFLAFTALARTGEFEGEFDEMLDRLDDIELDATAGADPTGPAG
jgi:hypothetical protein